MSNINKDQPLHNALTLSIADLVKRNVLTEKEAAFYIGMSRSFLRQDRMNGELKGRTKGPAFIRNGRCIRYLKSDLDAWLMQHRVVRTNQ